MTDSGDWTTITLGDVVSIRHGWAFKSEFFSTERSGYPIVVNIGNFRYSGGFRFEETVVREYRGNYPHEYELAPGEILLIMTCQTAGGEILGIPGRIPRDDQVYLHNQRLGRVVARDKSVIDDEFLYWLFRSSKFNKHLATSASGTKILHTSPQRIESFEFQLPPLPEQRAIAHILGTLDDKIELNRKMNATLDEIARTLFTSWFVTFDPVRAKAEGRQPEGMDTETAALFPDRFVDSELGPIPEGWKWSTLGEEFNVTMGQSPPGSTYNQTGEGIPFYQGRTDFGFRFPSVRVHCSGPTRFARSGDTLISVRAPVGDANIALTDCAIGRGVAALKHKSESESWTFHAVRSLSDRLEQFNDEGTVFGAVNQRDLKAIEVIAPIPSLVDAFSRLVTTLDALVRANEESARTLAVMRDALLPELLSGRVRVDNAEALVGDVVCLAHGQS